MRAKVKNARYVGRASFTNESAQKDFILNGHRVPKKAALSNESALLLYIMNVERFIFFMCFYAYSLLFHKEYAKKRNQGVPPWYPYLQLRALMRVVGISYA